MSDQITIPVEPPCEECGDRGSGTFFGGCPSCGRIDPAPPQLEDVRKCARDMRQLANVFADLSARLPAMTATLRDFADLLEGKPTDEDRP
jgi:hypothetical protein